MVSVMFPADHFSFSLGDSMSEYLDVVDTSGQPTGEIVERSIAHREGIPHRTAHLWLLRRRNGCVQILLQKRAFTKSFPGCYDISSAGHIPAGQDCLSSAVRELKEELGLTASETDLVYCGDIKIFWDDVFFGIPYHDRQYARVFLLWADVEEPDLILQEEEVAGVLWMDLNDCISAVAAGTIAHCISLEELQLVQNAVFTIIQADSMI